MKITLIEFKKVLKKLILELKEFDMDLSNLPNSVKIINDAYKNSDKKIYVVGGAIRDALLGTIPKDYDLVTDAKPEELERILSYLIDNKNKGIFPYVTYRKIGESFPVSLVVVYESETEKTVFEIASIKETFQKDAELRDLTINSLFFDINRKKILDYTETGFDDIKNKLIRIPNTIESDNAFIVTPLAILRSIRFSSRYNFNIDEKTQNDIIKYRDNLLSITAHNRIIEEFKKALKQSGQNYKLYLETLINFDLLKYIFKQNQLLFDVNEINKIKINDPLVISSFILKDLPNIDINYLTDLKGFDKNEIQIIIFLCNLYKNINSPDFQMAFKLKNSYKKIDQNIVNKFLESLGIASSAYEKLLNYLNTSLTTGRDFIDPITKQVTLKGTALEIALVDAEKKKYNSIFNINENKKYKNSYYSKKRQ